MFLAIHYRRYLGVLSFLILSYSKCFSQFNEEIYAKLYVNDSLLFQLGFNQCDTFQFEQLLSEDFEFYHDESGVTTSKRMFIKNFSNGICASADQPRRFLVPGSMKVYPLYNQGQLYGAIQEGKHEFYTREKHKSAHDLSSIAQFTHLWIIEGGSWKLTRILSFNHQPSSQKTSKN